MGSHQIVGLKFLCFGAETKEVSKVFALLLSPIFETTRA